MALQGVTETVATAQAVIASIVQETLKQKSMLLPLVSDYSGFISGQGAKSVDIPRRAQLSADDKSENTALTAQTMLFATDSILLTKHKAILANVEKISALQSAVAVEAEIIKEMAAELSLQIDRDLYAQALLTSASAPDHRIQYANTPTNTAGKADVIALRQLLNIANVPQEDRFLIINPVEESYLLSISQFVEAQMYGNSMALVNGELGRLFGFRVVMTNVATAGVMLAMHKSHVGFASQLQPEYMTQDDLDNVSKKHLIHLLYGSKVMDSGKRGVIINAAGT